MNRCLIAYRLMEGLMDVVIMSLLVAAAAGLTWVLGA